MKNHVHFVLERPSKKFISVLSVEEAVIIMNSVL